MKCVKFVESALWLPLRSALRPQIQNYGFLTIRSLDFQNQAFQQTTRSQNDGLFRPHFARTITAKNSKNNFLNQK